MIPCQQVLRDLENKITPRYRVQNRTAKINGVLVFSHVNGFRIGWNFNVYPINDNR